MPGLGTLLNVLGILAGGLAGLLFGKLLNERCQDTLTKACGLSVLFMSIGGALEEMLTVEGTSVTSGGTMLLVACLALGGLTGELLNVEDKFERFGAMAVVGSIEDGIFGNYSILATKAVLDLIIIMVMTSSMGKGCLFSAIPVAVFQGGVTALAQLIQPLMTEAALSNLSLVGSVLIFCIGLNLVWGKMVRVANLLPAIVFAVAFAFLPISF